MKHLLCCIFILLSLSHCVSAQNDADPTSLTIAIPASVMPGQASVTDERDYYIKAGSQENYAALRREYLITTSRGEVVVTLVSAVLDSRENAVAAFLSYPVSLKSDRRNTIGDRAFGQAPQFTAFLQGRAVVSIQLTPVREFDSQGLDRVSLNEFLVPFYDQILEQVTIRLEQEGHHRAEDLELTTQIVSSIASEDTAVEVNAGISSSYPYQVSYSWQVENADGEVLIGTDSTELLNDFKILWTGRDADGNLYPNGLYRLIIGVSDSLGRQDIASIDCSIESQANETVTINAARDSTIRAQKPHRNEGANPRLFLSHRLEARNKSLNPIVAFDLANTDLNGLTKATLVMNIQDCDLPRRWGNEGRSIEAHPMTQSWTEGNGNKYRQRGQEGKTKGEGTGVTWFSPADTQIRNNRPNGSSQWSGARMSLGPMTAPAVVVTNGQTGPVEFDVTQDVLNGYYEGWLLKKQDEAKFGNIRFFSKEAGDAEIAPKLLLEFNGPIASAPSSNSLLGSLTSFGSKLRPSPSGSELKTLREVLKESPTAARVGEQLLQTASHINPAVGFASTTAYRIWLS